MIKTPAWLEKYERPMKMPMGQPIGRMPSRYTGAGPDGVIQRSQPVTTDLYQDHEGETVISANDTKRAGGPKKVAEKLGIKHLGKPAPAPISGFMMGGHVRKHGYQTGGYVDSKFGINTPKTSDYPISAVPNDMGADEKPNTGWATDPNKSSDLPTLSVNPIDNPSLNTGWTSTSGIGKGTHGTGGLINDPEPYTEGGMGGEFGTPTPQQESIINANNEFNKTLQDKKALEAAAAQPPPTTADETTTGEGDTTTDTTGGETTTPPAGSEEEEELAYYSDQTKTYADKMMDLANMDSPLFKKMADIAFGNLNPQLQVGLTMTAMQIAQNPNMSEGMKQTVMAQAIQNVGIQQSGVAADLAKKSMDIATEAIEKGFRMSSDQQTFYETAARNAKTDAWRTFEYTAQYGSDEDVMAAYFEATGKRLDPSSVEEVRGYARTLRANNIIKDNLSIESVKNQLEDATYNSIVGMIGTGATFDQVKARFPNVTQDQYNSIYDAGPLGNRDWNRDMQLANTLLETGGEDNINKAAAIMNKNFPGVDIDFSPLLTAENREDFNGGMGLMIEMLSSGSDWNSTKLALENGGYLDALGGEAVAKEMYESMDTASNPIAQQIEVYAKSVMQWYPDLTLDTVKNAVSRFLDFEGGQVSDIDMPGLMEYLDGQKPMVSEYVSGEKPNPNSKYTIDYVMQSFQDTDNPPSADMLNEIRSLFTNGRTGISFPDSHGNTWYKHSDGSLSTVPPTVPKIGDKKVGDDTSEADWTFSTGTGNFFESIKEGETIVFDSPTRISKDSDYNVPIPNGTYTVKKRELTFKGWKGDPIEVLVYVGEDGKQYLAKRLPLPDKLKHSGEAVATWIRANYPEIEG